MIGWGGGAYWRVTAVLARWQVDNWSKPLLARWLVEPRAMMKLKIGVSVVSCLMSDQHSTQGSRLMSGQPSCRAVATGHRAVCQARAV